MKLFSVTLRDADYEHGLTGGGGGGVVVMCGRVSCVGSDVSQRRGTLLQLAHH